MRKVLTALFAVVIGIGSAGAASASETVPPEPPFDPAHQVTTQQADPPAEVDIFGVGTNPTLTPTPLCQPLDYYDYEQGDCLPTTFPTPDGTLPISTTAGCSVEGDMEGMFARREMMLFAECIVPMVEEWIDVETDNMPHPNAYVLIPSGEVRTEEQVTQGCSYYSMNMFYCSIDDIVYVGEEYLWTKFSRFGDVAALVPLAHEVGHRFQHVSQMGEVPRNSPNQEIPIENQADCVAGVFMDYLQREGRLSTDDVLDFAAGVINSGSPETDNRDHGTSDQRLRGFYVGYNSGSLVNCNFYVSDHPIIQEGTS